MHTLPRSKGSYKKSSLGTVKVGKFAFEVCGMCGIFICIFFYKRFIFFLLKTLQTLVLIAWGILFPQAHSFTKHIFLTLAQRNIFKSSEKVPSKIARLSNKRKEYFKTCLRNPIFFFIFRTKSKSYFAKNWQW